MKPQKVPLIALAGVIALIALMSFINGHAQHSEPVQSEPAARASGWKKIDLQSYDSKTTLIVDQRSGPIPTGEPCGENDRKKNKREDAPAIILRQGKVTLCEDGRTLFVSEHAMIEFKPRRD